MSGPAQVQAWLERLGPGERAAVDALREIVAEAAPQLSEEIKWNAPSFRDADGHKVTLGLNRAGGVRVVLHRGSRPDGSGTPAFEDPNGLAAWPASDRGVVTLADAGAVLARREGLVDLVRRWVAAAG